MPAFTPPAFNAVDFDLDAFTPPASTAVDFDLASTPPVGPVVTSPLGPTNGSGVAAGVLTDDIPLDGTPGAFLRLTFTSSRGTLRCACLPETP